MNKEIQEIIDNLREAFKDPEVKKNVLDQDWYDKNIKSGLDSTRILLLCSRNVI